MLVLAALSLVLAVLYPHWKARMLQDRVDTAVDRVEQLIEAAEEARNEAGTWPPTASDEELTPAPPASEGEVEGAGPTLEWRRLESVEVPSPPSANTDPSGEGADQEPGTRSPVFFHRGAVSVHTANESVLGALSRRYPGSVVHDTVWTLLLPRVPAAPD